MKKIFAGIIAAFLATAAYGQNAGTVTNHAYAIGKGPGVAGYTSLLCASGQLAVGSATDPTCRTVSGDAALSATGVLTFATVNPNVGTFGGVNSIPSFTVNAKGLVTGAAANVPAIPFTELTGQISCAQMPAAGLSGNVTTPSGSCVTTVVRVNGIAYAATAAIDTVPVTTVANTTSTYTALPNCTAGALQYSTGTHLFTCGTVGTVTSAVIAGTAGQIAVSGTCTITTTGTCTVDLAASRKTNPAGCAINATATATCADGSAGANNGTYTTPAGALWLEVELIGGGAGGAGSGTTPGNGGAGGNTTFSTFTGSGAAATVTTTGGAGGAASGGFMNKAGGSGGFGGQTAGSAGGNGCASAYGGQGQAGIGGTGTAPGQGTAAAANTGSGGGGAGVNATVSGGGGGGCGGFVRAVISAPGATFSYAIGAAGTAGTAGTGGLVGGAGGSGYIQVIPHFN